MEKEKQKSIAFTLRMIHNRIKAVIHKSFPRDCNAPQSQLQGGILGYLFHHSEEPVYQRDIEKEFCISRATATNTLQVMEKNGLIVRKSQDKDARLKRIVMTEPARERHAKVEEHMRLMDRKILQGMTETEISELYRLLGRLQDNLEQMESESGWEDNEMSPKNFLYHKCNKQNEAVPDEAVPDEAVPKEAVPDEAVPSEAVPIQQSQ